MSTLGPLRGDEPGRPQSHYVPQPKAYEYQAPHMLWEHRWLALAFTVIALGFGLYVYLSPHKQRHYEPDVYVEPVTPAAHAP